MSRRLSRRRQWAWIELVSPPMPHAFPCCRPTNSVGGHTVSGSSLRRCRLGGCWNPAEAGGSSGGQAKQKPRALVLAHTFLQLLIWAVLGGEEQQARNSMEGHTVSLWNETPPADVLRKQCRFEEAVEIPRRRQQQQQQQQQQVATVCPYWW